MQDFDKSWDESRPDKAQLRQQLKDLNVDRALKYVYYNEERNQLFLSNQPQLKDFPKYSWFQPDQCFSNHYIGEL